MTEHLRMDAPSPARRLDGMAQGSLGAPLERPDGPLKVSGRATYAHEWSVEGMVHGVLVRATVGHGRVERIDAGDVLGADGVIAVIDDDRLARNPAQGGANAAPVQGSKRIAYLGQPVALVVAESFEAASHAARTLVIHYESLAVEPDPETAGYASPEEKQSSQGDLDAAMASAAFAIDATYTTPGHNSAAMEPHAAIASWDGDDLLLRASCQMLKFNRNEIADSIGVDPERVRILSPFVGGGFGSKLGISPEAVAAALAARQIGRPVAVALSRQQVFEATMRRSETRQRVRLAADADGRLTGVGHEAWVSNLDGETFSEPVTQATPFLYRGENRAIGHHVARVNRTCAGSVRAPGEAVGMTVLENAMDELAEAAAIDPVELRRRNIPDVDPSSGKPFSSHMLRRALDRGEELFGWRTRPAGGARTRRRLAVGLGNGVRRAGEHSLRGEGAGHAASGRHRAGRDRHDRHRHRNLRCPDSDRVRGARPSPGGGHDRARRHRPAPGPGLRRLLGRIVVRILGLAGLSRHPPTDRGATGLR